MMQITDKSINQLKALDRSAIYAGVANFSNTSSERGTFKSCDTIYWGSCSQDKLKTSGINLLAPVGISPTKR